METIIITELERDCIACPTAWIGKTADGRELYIRFRWGDLTVKDRETRNIIYKNEYSGEFDGHMTVYELIDILSSEEFEFRVEYPSSFYTIPARECTFDIMGNWITELSCTQCSWTKTSDELEKLEYETILPPHCLSCGNEYEVKTEPPEQLQNMREKIDAQDDENVLDSIKENTSE